MMLCQLQVSAAAVRAGDKLSGAALCHIRSSLVLLGKLMVRLVFETETQNGPGGGRKALLPLSNAIPLEQRG